MNGSPARAADLPPAVSVLLVYITLLGLCRTLPALAALRLPELRAQLAEHLGAGITPLWAHLVVVGAMSMAALLLVWKDAGIAALFALVGALYAAEPLQAVGASEFSVERLLVPLVVALAILTPTLLRGWLAWSLGFSFVVALGVAVLHWSGLADDGGAAPWGNELFYIGDALLFPIGVVGVLVLVLRSKQQLSLTSLSLWSGFGPFGVFFSCALFWPALQELTRNEATVTTIVLSLVIAPVGVVVASCRHE